MRRRFGRLLTRYFWPRYHIYRWKRKGGKPPPFVKWRVLRRQKERILVETGTYRGDTVAAVRGRFDRIVTIELGEELAQRARERFADDPGVEVLQGDSAKVLPSVVARLEEPAVFWLDAHCSGGDTVGENVPLLEELRAIMESCHRHTILIDDADEIGHGDYPTRGEIYEIAFGLQVRLKDNILTLFRPS